MLYMLAIRPAGPLSALRPSCSSRIPSALHLPLARNPPPPLPSPHALEQVVRRHGTREGQPGSGELLLELGGHNGVVVAGELQGDKRGVRSDGAGCQQEMLAARYACATSRDRAAPLACSPVCCLRCNALLAHVSLPGFSRPGSFGPCLSPHRPFGVSWRHPREPQSPVIRLAPAASPTTLLSRPSPPLFQPPPPPLTAFMTTPSTSTLWSRNSCRLTICDAGEDAGAVGCEAGQRQKGTARAHSPGGSSKDVSCSALHRLSATATLPPIRAARCNTCGAFCPKPHTSPGAYSMC